MLHYRLANEKDAVNIALLHTQSWQHHYRGIWSDAFLDGPVVENRLAVWQKRLLESPENQLVLLAESAGQLVGFVCMYANENPQYGALLDNLHVSGALQGQGIGKELVRRAATWLYARDATAIFYLWVLKRNVAAQGFYDRLGGERVECVAVQNPDGSFTDCYRYVWRDLQRLILT